MSVVVAARHLSKWYGQVKGLNEVTLEIGAGVTGLLGPNGAGKSTFLKLACGQLRPSRGEVRIFGQIPWNNAPMWRRLGFAPEGEQLYDTFTGPQLLTGLLRLAGYSQAEAAKRALAALEQVRLSPQTAKKIGAYSKGMRQRFKLAQAIAHDPDCIILDEPLNGLDPVGRYEMMDLIRKLGDAGKCVIVSSHILHEVEQVTRSIVLMYRGRVLAEGNVHEIRGLIDRHPHQVRFVTDQPRRLAEVLIGQPEVIALRVDGENQAVLCQTPEPDAFYAKIPGLLLDSKISVRQLTSPDDNLQAVFNYLTEG